MRGLGCRRLTLEAFVKVELFNAVCVVTREPGDTARIEHESQLLHHVKLALIAQGHDVVKKRMWKDGHLTADSQHYVRSRKCNRPGAFGVYDANYQTRNAAEDYRRTGRVIYTRVALSLEAV